MDCHSFDPLVQNMSNAHESKCSQSVGKWDPVPICLFSSPVHPGGPGRVFVQFVDLESDRGSSGFPVDRLDLCSDDVTRCSVIARHVFSVHLTVHASTEFLPQVPS